MNKIIKLIKYCTILLLLSNCSHGCFLVFCASDGWYAQQSREKFIRLSPEERDKERVFRKNRCQKLGIICESPPEPTPEEQERLKNKDSWKYKIRSWYYRVW
jgi:hypothetical protein